MYVIYVLHNESIDLSPTFWGNKPRIGQPPKTAVATYDSIEFGGVSDITPMMASCTILAYRKLQGKGLSDISLFLQKCIDL